MICHGVNVEKMLFVKGLYNEQALVLWLDSNLRLPIANQSICYVYHATPLSSQTISPIDSHAHWSCTLMSAPMPV